MSELDGTITSFRGAEPQLFKPSSERAGTVTQLTNNTTAVTLHAKHGAVTMQGTVASGAKAAFTVNNDRVQATDIIHLTVEGVTTTAGLPIIAGIGAVAAGSFQIVVHNLDAANATAAAPIVHFKVHEAEH